jgi:signal transduction histidine kinase
MGLNLRGIAFRGWATIALLCGTALALALVIQLSPLLGQLSNRIRWWEIEDAGQEILSHYGQADGFAQISRITVEHSYEVMIVQADLHVVLWVDGYSVTSNPKSLGDEDLSQERIGVLRSLEDALQASGEPVSEVLRHVQPEHSTYVYFARLEDPERGTCFLYLAHTVATPNDTTTRILQTQVLLAAMIMMVMVLVVAMPVSHRLTRPIVRLTKSAQRLAHGDLTTEFNGHGFSETEQLAATLTYAAAQLRELDADRKELLANVSHDLKTPLTIIKIYAETIRDVSGDDPVKRQAHCDTIIEEANRLTEMVNEIVEISRLESGATSINLTEINLATVLQDALTSFAILVESEGYTFDTTIAESAPIMGNEHIMKRALYNLIGNAVNYTGEDRFVGVRLIRRATDVRFEVTDTGVGIPPDKIATIWDRYYKSRVNHARGVAGTGIGLSIVKRILTMHEARFGVTSQPTQGSCFWFECDLAPSAKAGHRSAVESRTLRPPAEGVEPA